MSRVDDSIVKLKAARRGKEDSDFLVEQCFKDIHKGVAEPLKTAERWTRNRADRVGPSCRGPK